MRKTLLAASVATALAAPGLAMAQASSPHPLAGNMTIASDYRFRGVSQTYLGPAIQGFKAPPLVQGIQQVSDDFR